MIISPVQIIDRQKGLNQIVAKVKKGHFHWWLKPPSPHFQHNFRGNLKRLRHITQTLILQSCNRSESAVGPTEKGPVGPAKKDAIISPHERIPLRRQRMSAPKQWRVGRDPSPCPPHPRGSVPVEALLTKDPTARLTRVRTSSVPKNSPLLGFCSGLCGWDNRNVTAGKVGSFSLCQTYTCQ